MTMRQAISKKKRFDIFKRDGFQCQYCGSSPPGVVLEIGHIKPVSKGGDNSSDNLIAACFDCNRGKSNGLLCVSPETLADKAEKLAEKRDQLKAFERLQKSIKRAQDKQIDELQEVMRQYYCERVFTDKFRNSIRQNFMPNLSFSTIKDAMEIAMARIQDAEGAIKYFCGICWKNIKAKP